MKLVYLTTCFATPSHTFIRRELREFEKRGIAVSLLGIRKDQNRSDDSEDLVARTHYLYPVRWLNVLLLNLYFAVFRPNRYWPCLYSCLFESSDRLKSRLKLTYHLLISVSHAKYLIDNQITHVHAHFLNVSSSVAMFSARLAKIPYSITVHSAGEKDLPHVIGIALKLKYAEKLLMISRYNIRYYNDIFPCEEKAHVIRCGMDIDAFDPRAFQPTGMPVKLLAVGRFVEKKGFHVLLEAARILKNKQIPFNLDILGYGPDFEKLKTFVKENNLEDSVTLPGQATSQEVKTKMREADAVVIPSVTSKTGEMEGIPVVVMEAMASAIPVIASAHSGIPELVSDVTGDLVPENDAKALANTIEHFKATAEKVSAARSLILSEFNISHVVDQRHSLFAD